MYYFNVVHVFYVMRNSPSCDIAKIEKKLEYNLLKDFV